jgi:beta-lactamase class A
MRRAAMGIALLLAIGSLPLSGASAVAAPALAGKLDALFESFPGRAAVWVADPAVAQPLYTREPDRGVIAASLYKLGLLLAVEDQVERGKLRYTDTITIEHEDITADGSFEAPGTEMTIDEALEAMITVSDNGTAVHFRRTLGGSNVNALLKKSGIAGFHVAEDQEEDDVVTARAVGTLFTKLAKGELLSKAASQRMTSRLERQQINDRIPAQLPEGTRVAHKTGNLVGYVHDAGIIFLPRTQRVVVAMTWDTDDDPATRLIAHLASAVHTDALLPPASARYRVPLGPQYVQQGKVLALDVAVENTGSVAWTATGPGRMSLVWEMRDMAGAVVGRATAPRPLGEVPAGATVVVPLQVAAPQKAGDAKVVLGLVDGSGRALAPLGVATATIAVRVHLPLVAETAVTIPSMLHRREASLIEVAYRAFDLVRFEDHDVALGWRFIDPATDRVVAEGAQPLGMIKSYQRTGIFFAPLVAPNVRGTYVLEYELREGGQRAGVTRSRMVEIGAPRIWGGENVGAPRKR